MPRSRQLYFCFLLAMERVFFFAQQIHRGGRNWEEVVVEEGRMGGGGTSKTIAGTNFPERASLRLPRTHPQLYSVKAASPTTTTTPHRPHNDKKWIFFAIFESKKKTHAYLFAVDSFGLGWRDEKLSKVAFLLHTAMALHRQLFCFCSIALYFTWTPVLNAVRISWKQKFHLIHHGAMINKIIGISSTKLSMSPKCKLPTTRRENYSKYTDLLSEAVQPFRNITTGQAGSSLHH